MANTSQRQSNRLRAAQSPAPTTPTSELTPSDALPPAGNQLASLPDQPSVASPVPIAPRPDILRVAPMFNNPQANVPLYGSLNAMDAIFYCKASLAQLKTIVASAPHAARAHLPANPTKDLLLETVLGFRQAEAVAASLYQRSPQESLRELINLPAHQLKTLSTSDPNHLGFLMRAAVLADPDMQPRVVPSDPHEMLSTVLMWQVDALKTARALPDTAPPPPVGVPSQERRERQDTPRASVHPRPALPATNAAAQIPTTAAAIAMPAVDPHTRAPTASGRPAIEHVITGFHPGAGPANTAPANMDSDDEDWTRNGKRQKIVVPQGFTYGSTANIEQVLKNYPGKATASPALAFKELLGPVILAQIIGGGASVPKFLQDFKHWRRPSSGLPSHAEMEAHTLGRTIHMEMLKHDSPFEALQHRPSLEIILRRLFAVLYVEEAVNKGMFQDRPSAWHFVHSLHESTPMGTVMCDQIDDSMTQRMTPRNHTQRDSQNSGGARRTGRQ